MDKAFCIEAVEEALTRYGKPEIPAMHGIVAIGIKAASSPAWRSPARVHGGTTFLSSGSVAQARTSHRPIYIDGFYNGRRPHSSLERRTPDQAYFKPADADTGGGITKAEIRLKTACELLKQTEPPQVAVNLQQRDNARLHIRGNGRAA